MAENDDLEDFELQKPKYQVWALSYTEDDEYTGEDQKLYESQDPDKAVDFAKTVKPVNISWAPDAAYVSLEVETVVKDEDGDEMNVGTVWSDNILNPDYELKNN